MPTSIEAATRGGTCARERSDHPRPQKKLIGSVLCIRALYQGFVSGLCIRALYQGTASAVPQLHRKLAGFSPCGKTLRKKLSSRVAVVTRPERRDLLFTATNNLGAHVSPLRHGIDSIPINSIQRFAGDDYTRARYYDFDPDFPVEMEPHVRHYNLYTAASPEHPW